MIALPFCYVSLTAHKPPDPRLPDPPTTLGEHLLGRRHRLGLLQKEAAEQLGADVWTYANWEKDRTTPALRFRPSIYRWLGYWPADAPVKTLGERLRRWRELRGLSRDRVARTVGVDPGTIWRLEVGRTPASSRVRWLIQGLMDGPR